MPCGAAGLFQPPHRFILSRDVNPDAHKVAEAVPNRSANGKFMLSHCHKTFMYLEILRPAFARSSL
jgi:hypothetical protein